MIATNLKTTNLSSEWLHRVIDLIVPITTLFLILQVTQNSPWDTRYIILGSLGSVIFLVSAQVLGLYQTINSYSLFSSLKITTIAWSATWIVLIILAFLYKDAHNLSRLNLSLWAVITPFLLFGYRLAIFASLQLVFKQKKYIKKIALLGSNSISSRFIETVEKSPWLGYGIEKVYENEEEIYNDLHIRNYEEVYICLPLTESERIKTVVNRLSNTPLTIKFIPDIFVFDLMHTSWYDLAGMPVISIFDSHLNRRTNQLIKRTEDFLLSTVIIVLTSPLLLVIALLIKTTSPGPILFKQLRYGINGQKIRIYKFRSMTTMDNGAKIVQATKNDNRITKIGAFLRKTSLDELPQFFNVLQGKMSIVGPRPHAVAHNEEYKALIPQYMQRHIVKPGITGWAQVNGWRGETDTLEKMEKRVEFDLHYINNWSLWFDMQIIILTIFKGFINKNAY